MKGCCLGLFFFICISSYGQFSINGIVIDSFNLQPLHYVSVLTTSGRVGTLTDNTGRFSLIVPDSLGKNRLVFTCVGYETQSLSIDSLSRIRDVRILLRQKSIIMPEARIVTYKKSELCKERWGSHKSSPRGDYLMNYGCEVALYIPNYEGDSGIISNLKYFVVQGEGNPSTPFRAKLYYLNPKDSTPGELMLDTNLVVEADHGNSWVSVNVSKLNIFIPKSGFFVSMEWLPACECYPDSIPSPKGQTEFYGQVLGGNMTLKSNYTWLKNTERGWIHSHSEFESKPFNAMIAADVMIKCK